MKYKINIIQKIIFALTISSYLFSIWLFIDIERFYNKYDFEILKESIDLNTLNEQLYPLYVNYPAEYTMYIDFKTSNVLDTFSSINDEVDYYNSIIYDSTLHFIWTLSDDSKLIVKDSTYKFLDRGWVTWFRRDIGDIQLTDTGNYTLKIHSTKSVPQLVSLNPIIKLYAVDYKSNNYGYSIIWAFLLNCLLTSISIGIIILIRVKNNKSKL